MVAYYKRDGIIYKQLLLEEEGAWLIDYNHPGAPVFVSHHGISQMERVSCPDYTAADKPSAALQATKEKRLKALELLLKDYRCICDKGLRSQIARAVAGEQGLSVRTICNWYYAYLAGGEQRLCPKGRKKQKQPLTEEQKAFRRAINKYYYSARRMSLRGAYDMMLLDAYTDEEGRMVENYPTFYQFRYFYYSRAKNPVKMVIARQGISDYQRNSRPLYGSASGGKDYIGVYQMDATVGDIYLVSRHNRKQIIGRPYIYLAVDTATQLIAGIYIGLESGEEAVTECLRQAASDKVAYCKRFGIEIQPEQWPSAGLPGEIITDRGREFIGSRMDELCMQYGIVSTGLPPYRPDLKGLVESTLHALQERYKYILKRKGVVEPDFQDRGAPDYRREATLNLDEFTQVMIHSVLYCNGSHVLKNYVRTPEMAEDDVRPISSDLWRWHRQKGKSRMVSVQGKDCLALLPRAVAHFTRRGLTFRNLTYRHDKYNTRCAAAGLNGREEVRVAYDPLCTDAIYLMEDGEYTRFELTSAKPQFKGSTYAEVQLFLENERRVKRELAAQETEGRVSCNGSIKGIAQSALAEREELHGMEAVEAIGKHREIERREQTL